ncbi:M43 family zinc metalloprotease [Spirosoma panaciterrae]|uniref:M43 family zinc metalloprotease n=1 Tax=Spirosoma panaciterrae TaxID=496058 RepID=UPI000371D64A|nr:M43 family zinc metalloprotease [Spirosoma panaciterrae]
MIKQGTNRLTLSKRTVWAWLIGSLVLLISPLAGAQTPSDSTIKRCAVVNQERLLQQRDPGRLQLIQELNRRIEQRQNEQKSLRTTAADTTVYRIPIVVHVVHNTASGAIGGTNNVNISDAQILSQIQVLNEDYRRKAGTNGYNTSSIGADARIEFFLATLDPNGNPTNGITRHYYPAKATFDIETDDVLLSQIAYWPSDQYLNIWVADYQGDYIGYGQFPTAADTLKGLQANLNVNTDGVRIDYQTFGRQIGTVNRMYYMLGRTVSHEIGHWLGLIHPWGDGNGCNEDYVADTPLTEDRSASPTSCKQTYSTCVAGKQTRDLVENYMMYSPDACMNMFTAGQVGRMRAVLALSPRRAKVVKLASITTPLSESEQLTVKVYPNPYQSDLPTDIPLMDVLLKGAQSFQVDVFDGTGRQVRTASYTNSSSTRLTLPVTGLAKGMYIVRVKTDSETVSKRFVVQ